MNQWHFINHIQGTDSNEKYRILINDFVFEITVNFSDIFPGGGVQYDELQIWWRGETEFPEIF